MPLRFSVTYDYRCPFARIAHDHVVTGLRSGADWEVTFSPLSLGQMHVADGDPDVWDEPSLDRGLLALQASVAVRDHQPDLFLDTHHALFEARHADGMRLADEPDIRKVLERVGVEPEPVFAAIASGEALATVRAEHEALVASHDVWGVPTFVSGDSAVFVRLMARADGDGDLAVRSVERIVDMIDGWPDLNEFKHTRLTR